jgi:hypothetical protein
MDRSGQAATHRKAEGNPVDVYGVLDWLATSAQGLLTPDIGHVMVRMQHAVFVDRDGSTECR